MEDTECSFKLIVPIEVHCVTSQKTIIFIFIVMRISDITQKTGIANSYNEFYENKGISIFFNENRKQGI
jgi:hypothetical protein